MCGIVGVIGNPQAVDVVTTGLSRLEYRGYDSAGLAVLGPAGAIHTCKAVGKLAALMAKIPGFNATLPTPPTTAIGHTRWATHGAPTEANAHPHVGTCGAHTIAVVHNGIIENYNEYRTTLAKQGATFASETDTEIIPNALAHRMQGVGVSLVQAVQQLTPTFRGHFAFVAMAQGKPDELVGTRRGAPLCVGLAEGASYLVSDPLALAGICSRFVYLEDDDVVHLTPNRLTITDKNGLPTTRPVTTLDLSTEASGKQGFKHFMLKEIHEQPAVCARILQEYTDAQTLLPCLPLLGLNLATVTTINIVACGTANYAGQVGKYAIESLSRIPTNTDIASEFRYRTPPLRPGDLFIAVSQSGETADTLAALEHAKANGQQILVLTNTPTSTMARMADAVINLQAGREIAVASTKAFTAMVLNLILLGLQLGHARGHLSGAQVHGHTTHLRTLPGLIESMLSHTGVLQKVASGLTGSHSALFLGRGMLAPLAYEGALKMKEISYIHAEGYASGEMKHGPIALVEPGLPVINLATSTDGLFEKTLSNLQEVAARRGHIILVTDDAGATQLPLSGKQGLTLVTVPSSPPLLAPIIFAVPLQLLAYLTATEKGTDVDQPRNLAKSVTVE